MGTIELEIAFKFPNTVCRSRRSADCDPPAWRLSGSLDPRIPLCSVHPMSSVTQNWLRQNITAYTYPDPVFSHILSLLLLFPTIRPKSDVYSAWHSLMRSIANSRAAFDDGRAQLLLCVYGLLPISFRNASYNIPVAVWITRDYPKEPPITFVVPTNDMLVKPGKYLDVSGRCSIDYLQHWQRKHEV